MSQSSRRRFLQSATLAAATSGRMEGYQKPNHFTIDCQSHLFVPELLAFMEKRKTSPYVYRKDGAIYVVVGDWHRRLPDKYMDVEAKLADMDEAGINMTAISINDPGPELFGNDGAAIARMLNDYIGGLAKKYPERFIGLMVLPLQDENAAIKELERCVNTLGMKGMLLYSNQDGAFPDEPPYRWLFAQAEKLEIPILLHPAFPVTYEQTKGYSMAAGLGLMFDTTIALARIILAGILDQHPKLKLVCPHVGGALPYLIGRIDHQTQVLKRGAENIEKLPSEYLKNVWLDAVSPIPLAIRYGIDFAGANRMLYSSDHPWVDPKLISGHIQSLKLPPEDQARIFGENAKKLFKI